MLRRRTGHRHAHRAALAALAALAGCGGGDDDSTTTGSAAKPLSRAEFLAEANRICFSTDSRIEAAADDLVLGRRQPDPAEVRRVVESIVIPGLESEVRAIRALGAPPGDEPEIERILAATERGIAAIEAEPESVLDGPPPALRRAGELARDYGSVDCGVE